MNTVMQLVDKLRDTSHSHDRCSVVEVMGRDAGYIAVNSAVACGAVEVLCPEKEYNVEEIIAKMKASRQIGKQNFIIIVAEGIGHSQELAERIQREMGIEARATILGHVQRGGSPTVRDRVLASQMGNYAVNLLEKGIGNRVVGIRGTKLVDYDIQEALQMTKPFDDDLYELTKVISI